jgi:hypothetical protein
VEGGLLNVQWTLGDGSTWHLAAHFGSAPTMAPASVGTVVYEQRAEGGRLLPDGVRVTLESPHG